MKTEHTLLLGALLATLTACVPPATREAPQPRQAAPAPAPVNPFASFEQTRASETAFMEQARTELASVLSGSKNVKQITVFPLQFAEQDVTDLKTQQSQRFRVVSTLAVTMPLLVKKEPVYERFMSQVQKTAEYIADTRNAAEIMFFYNAADVRAQKISLEGGVANSPRGNPITVTKAADAQIPRGAMRVVIKAAALRNNL